MITQPPGWDESSEKSYTVWLYEDGVLPEACPGCSVIGVRVIEYWRAGIRAYTRQTMMPCHCVIASTKGLGGLGPRADIPYGDYEGEQ